MAKTPGIAIMCYNTYYSGTAWRTQHHLPGPNSAEAQMDTTTGSTSRPMAAGATRPAYGIAPAGFRLPDATRVGRVRLQVADLARSIAYYESVIGLRVV